MGYSKSNLFLFVFIFFILSCGKDEASSDCTNQSLTGNFKGAVWTLESVTHASIFKGKDPLTGKNGYRLDIIANGKDGSKLNIVVNEFEKGIHGDCMDVNKTWSTKLSENYYDPIDSSVEIAIFIYTDPSGNGFTTFGQDLDGTFKITNCDESNHKISGTFHFNIYDQDLNEVTFSNGKFENICFQ